MFVIKLGNSGCVVCLRSFLTSAVTVQLLDGPGCAANIAGAC
jgi:hypothetical protein